MTKKGATFFAICNHQEELVRNRQQFLQKTKSSTPGAKVRGQLPSSAASLSFTGGKKPTQRERNPRNTVFLPSNPSLLSQADAGQLLLLFYLASISHRLGQQRSQRTGERSEWTQSGLVPKPRLIMHDLLFLHNTNTQTTLSQMCKPSGRVQESSKGGQITLTNATSQFHPRNTTQPATIFLQETISKLQGQHNFDVS